ncbi:MAG: response regulator transcription factor [Alphaproteobacteria bacterium]|nr:response regulator transcription factor [Alphaproteobacteria bacterium]
MNKTILVIDDDDTLTKSLNRGLQQYDFFVITANSAEQAGEILSKLSVDAIVLDRMMGGMDGLTFLKCLRDSGNTTPVIMLTALSGAEHAIDGLSGGANDYLAKPFQLKELVLRLQNIIKQTPNTPQNMPNGLIFADNEFFIKHKNDEKGRLFALSNEEKRLLHNLTSPMGNIVAAAPMVAKRLRTKINSVLSGLDIITIRGRGYKLIPIPATEKR